MPTPASARFAEDRVARREAVEFHAKALGREYCGEGWLQRIERRVEKSATPVTVLTPNANIPPRALSGGPKSPSKEMVDGMHSSDIVPASSSRQAANLQKRTPRARSLRKQMGSGRKAKPVEGHQPFAEMTEAILHVHTAERHIVERKKEDSASRQVSVLHPAVPRYPELTTESSQMGVEWTLTDSQSVDDGSHNESSEYHHRVRTISSS